MIQRPKLKEMFVKIGFPCSTWIAPGAKYEKILEIEENGSIMGYGFCP